MKNKTKNTKWTAKLKALVISVSLAFAVALGGAGAAIGLSLTDNGRLGGSPAGGVSDSAETNVNIGTTVEVGSADMWAEVIEAAAESSADSYVEAKLVKNITATGGSFGTSEEENEANPYYYGALNVPADSYVVLDLNGYTINRGLTEAVEYGSVIINYGNLIITDGSAKGNGKITGGNTSDFGGGVRSRDGSTLTLAGGNFTGNKSSGGGGGVSTIAMFVMTGGTISNNSANYGGGLFSSTTANSTINNGTISGNTATGNGAGIQASGSLTINGGTISGNTATGNGGGIYSIGTLTISGGTISDNRASSGGGIYTTGNLTVENAEIFNNTAGMSGGAIYALAAAPTETIPNPIIEISNSTLSNNTAVHGGAIAGRGAMILDSVTATGNTAKGGNGGGINLFTADAANYPNSGDYYEVTLKGETKISGNESTASASGITDTNAGRGGGIWIGSRVTLNISEQTEINDNVSAAYGAGVYTNGGSLSVPTTVNMTGGTVSGNECLNYGGAGFYLNTYVQMTMSGGTISGNKSDETGGGIAMYGATLTIKDGATITGNYADSRGGGIYAASGYLKNGTTNVLSKFISTINVEGGEISDNTTERGGGIFVIGTSYSAAVGTIIDGETLTAARTEMLPVNLNITGGEISGNVATDGGGIYSGGGLESLIIKSVIVKENISLGRGGGIFVNFGSTMEITGGTYSNNSANEGGAIWVGESGGNTNTLSNATIIGNTSNVSGGGVRLDGGTANITNCTVQNNKSYGVGGGCYWYNANVTVTGGEISGNTSGTRGGGIFIQNHGSSYSTTITDTTISGNSASNGGGIHSDNAGSLTLDGVEVTGNYAVTGGGIYNEGTLTLNGVEITDNYAMLGGGVYANATINLKNTVKITGNYGAKFDSEGALVANTAANNNATLAKNNVFTIGTVNKSSVIGVNTTVNSTVNSEKGCLIDNGFNQDFSSIYKPDINTHTVKTYNPMGGIWVSYLKNNNTTTEDTNVTRWRYAAENSSDSNPIRVDLLENWSGASGFGNGTGFVNGAIEVPAGRNIILNLNGKLIDRGATNDSDRNYAYSISVKGTLTIIGSGSITGGYAYVGGAINVAENGKLVLNGGTITDNGAYQGGAISVNRNGTLIMNGGEISENISDYQYGKGGAVYIESGTFEMHGGTITGNKSTGWTGYGGAIYATSSKVTIDGGLIYNNKATNSGTGPIEFYKEAGYASGGGIYLYSCTTTIGGGAAIYENTGIGMGGGIYMNGGTLKMTGGRVYSNRCSESSVVVNKDGGGGVYVKNGSFTMEGGQIYDNTLATVDDNGQVKGGDVCIAISSSNNTSTFTMKGGSISVNPNSGKSQNGVYVTTGNTFNFEGGKITRSALTSGSTNEARAICVVGGTVNMSGTAEITGYIGNRTPIMQYGGTLNISGGRIYGNNTGGSAGAVSVSAGTLIISGGEIYNNSAANNAGAIHISGGTVNIIGGKIYNNTAYNGGGMYLGANASVTIGGNAEIYGNTARSGGGIYAHTGTTLNIEGGKIYNNTANGDIVSTATGSAYGGGIFATGMNENTFVKAPTINITGGKIYGNSAISNGSESAGGAISITRGTLKISGGKIYKNTANIAAGAINVAGGTFDFTGGEIYGNKVTNTVSVGYIKGGGAVRLYTGAVMNFGANTNGTYSGTGVIYGNTADKSVGGAIYVIDSGSTLNMYSGEIYGNKATLNGSDYGYGGGIYTESTVNLYGGEISNNTADAGGGVYVAAGGTFTMSDGTISDNTSSWGGGIFVKGTANLDGGTISDNTGGQGGGVAVINGKLNLGTASKASTVVISNNITETNGGGIYTIDPAPTKGVIVNMYGGTITGNYAGSIDYGGGGILVNGGCTFNMYSGVISENITTYYGGGVYNRGTFNMNGGTISGNEAINGGGVYNANTFTMNNGEISDNEATNGAGVFATSTFTMGGGEITDNTASNHGGGVYVVNGTFTMSDGEITDNVAVEGGGVLTYLGTVNLSGGEISGNTADAKGAGVHVNGTLNVSGSAVVTGNTLEDGKTISNVYLSSGKTITVTATLNSAAEIGVTAEDESVAFTSGFGAKSGLTHPNIVFSADVNKLVVGTNGSTGTAMEAKFAEGYNINLAVYGKDGAATGQTALAKADKDTNVTYTVAKDKITFSSTQGGRANIVTVIDLPEVAGYTPYLYNPADGNAEVKSGEGILAPLAANVNLRVGYRANASTEYKVYYILQQPDGSYTDKTAPNELQGMSSVKVYTGTGTTDKALTYKSTDNKALYNGDTAWDNWSHYSYYRVEATNDTIANANNPTIGGAGNSYVLVYLKLNEYKVTFSATGASNVPSARTLRFGATIEAPTKKPVKASSTFKYWSTTRDGEEFDFENSTVTGDITLYAVFEVTPYKVIFDFNVGNGVNQLPSSAVKTVNIGGNLFNGIVNWEVDTLFDESFKWKAEVDEDDAETGRYEITYSVENLVSNKRITGVNPTTIGYTFAGWFIDVENASERATEVIRVPNDETEAEIVLTAKWARTEYTIRLDAQNDTRITTQPYENLTVWSEILPETNPTKTGNTFKGWYVTNDSTDINHYLTPENFSRSTQGGEGLFCIADFVAAGLTDASKGYTVTLYGEWTPLPVSIKVADSDKGTLTFAKNNATLGDNATVNVGDVLTVTVKENAGYKFKNLIFNLQNGTQQALRDYAVTFTVTTALVNTVTEGDKTDYFISVDAAYTEQRFTIEYKLDGGRSTDTTFAKSFSPSELLATSSNRAKLPSLLTKNGYDFDGWIYSSTEDDEFPAYAHERFVSGEYYGEELFLVKPASYEYRNITLKATWKPQTATVYLYNASYTSPEYNYNSTGKYYSVVQDDNAETIVTGSKIHIISPERDSFMFLGWATTRNGAVVYPAVNYDSNDKADPIEYIVNADHDTDGNPLNRNNLYAVWHVKDVNYIIMTANNNNCTYGGDGIKMSAKPAQDYTNTDANITLTYHWYRVFAGMYDNCFTVTDYVDKDGYKWYLDANGDIATYEKDGKYYDTDKNEVSEPTGTKFTIKDFNSASVGTACEEKFRVPNVSPNAVPEVTVKNVANCGTYICVVDVVATEGSGQTTREKGYGEIEISMSKAAFGNLKLETVETEYNTEAQYNKVMLDLAEEDENTVLPQYADDGLLVLPDGSKAIVTYTYYKGAGELIEGVTREQITDLSQIKNVGSYHVVVSFTWAVGGDKGNYFELTSLEADLIIGQKTIKTVDPQFVKDGEAYEADYTGTYDGSSYGVEFVIKDKVTVNDTSTAITEIDDVAVAVKVYLITENGDVEVLPENLPTTDAGTYAVVIQGLTGEAAGNYILKSGMETRQEYTIGKKKLEVADYIHFDDDDKPVYDGKPHTISISFDEGHSLPEYVTVTYSSVYVAEDSGFTTTKKLNNGGTDAGIYAVTAKFNFADTAEGIAAANNYEKLADMTATLTINKADFFDFHNEGGSKDVLRDSGFVSASHGFQTGKQHHPYVKDNFGCDSSDVSVTYAYYSVNTENQTRTCLTGVDEDGNAVYYTHSALETMGNALVAEGKRGYISAAGKYEIIAHINYESAAYRNNFADVAESKTTITYDIEGRAIESVTVVAWADGFDMKAKLGEAFNYEWIKQINIVYEGDAGTLEITRPEDVELAGIDYGTKNSVAQNSFWHVGTFGIYVSYYGKPSAVAYEFNVVEEVTDVTLKYRVGTEGEYKPVPEDGLVLLTEGVYNFEISYTGTNTEGNKEQMVKYATVKGTPALGAENVLEVADAGNYEFGDIKIKLYEVLTDVAWEYSLDGTNWTAIPESGELVYAGKAYGIRVVKDGMTFDAHTEDNSDVLYVNGYVMKVGRSGNYLIEEDKLIAVTKKQLGFTWNSETFEYNMLSHVPTMTGSGVEEADVGSVMFVYNYTDSRGNDILSTESIVSVGTYKVKVSMVDNAAASNYKIDGAANAEFTFSIVQADIKVKEVYYSEYNYGKNVTYKGNGELRRTAMKIDFGENASVGGSFRFIRTVDGKDVEINGTEFKESLKSKGAITVKYVYVPNNSNYKDLAGSITVTVAEPTMKTGAGSLSVELGPDAIDFYMLEDRIDTHDIHVYQLYESTYQENGQWYGAREEVPNPIFRIDGYSGTIETYRVNAQDISSGKIVLIARIMNSSNSGTIELLAIDKTPSGIEIANIGEFRTKYYVGETPEFRDIEFRLLFGGNAKPVSGLKVPSIKADFNRELTANDDKFTVTFRYANVSVPYQFEALPKENLEIIWPTNLILTYTGEKIAVPELKFSVDTNFDGQSEIIGQNDLEGVEVRARVYNSNNNLTNLQAEGEYTVMYEFTVTNPRFITPDSKQIKVTVTDNPYRVTITVPSGSELSATYTGKAIDIPVPTISEVVDTRDDNQAVNAEIKYTISDGKNTPVETELSTGTAWKKTNAGTYKVTVQVNVDGKEVGSAEYTFVIGKATKNAIGLTVNTVTLGDGANFRFPVTADFGADTVRYEYSLNGTTWRTEAPDEAGRWYVRVTIAQTDNYVGAQTNKQFEVRANGTTAEAGEGYVEGSVEGGDGVGKGWQLVITDRDVSGESVSNQNVLDGYDVVLKDDGGTTVQPEKAYTVKIKLNDELSGRKDLNVYFKDADGKLTKLDASVEDGYIVFKTSNFGSFIITSAQPKESVGPLVAVIVLGVVAAGAIAACVIVFILKKKKRGAQ